VTDIEPAADSEAAPSPSPASAPALPPSRLTPKERQIGLALAGLAGVSGVAQWLPDAIGKSDGHAFALAAISLVLAAVFGFAVFNGRRLVASFAAVLAGLPTPKFVVGTALNALLLAFGAYLMLRYSNAAGKRAAEQRQQRSATRRAARGGSGGRGRGRGGSATSSAADTAQRKAASPGANKRYTPPKKTTKRR
jgi:hypothetical protein